MKLPLLSLLSTLLPLTLVQAQHIAEECDIINAPYLTPGWPDGYRIGTVENGRYWVARCRDRRQRLDLNFCFGNFDGNLGATPNGQAVRSCRDCSLAIYNEGNGEELLECECRRTDGSWRRSSIDIVPVITILNRRAKCFGYEGQVFVEDEAVAEDMVGEAGLETEVDAAEDVAEKIHDDSVLGGDLKDGKFSELPEHEVDLPQKELKVEDVDVEKRDMVTPPKIKNESGGSGHFKGVGRRIVNEGIVKTLI